MRVQWGQHERQRYSIYPKIAGETHWVIIIHGGAWRDPRITDLSAQKLARQWDSGGVGGIISVDYRLSPKIRDPEHVRDCLAAIEHAKHDYRIEHLTLVGHSCGAFICGQLAKLTPDLVTKIVGVEGIYDLHDLVSEYPSYASFVSEAFGTGEWPVIKWSTLPLQYVVQSPNDSLLSMRQTELMLAKTQAKLVKSRGDHDEVFEENLEWAEKVR